MPTAIREQVLAAFALVFSSQTGAGESFNGVTIERNLDHKVTLFPTLNVVDGDQTPDHDNSGITLYTVSPTVEGYVQAASKALLTASVTDLYARVVAAATADYTLGGLAIDVREGALATVSDKEGSNFTAEFTLQFDIDYATKPGDPYTLGP